MQEQTPNFPEYQAFASLLSEHSISVPGSEVQGIIVGVLCLPNADDVDWLELVLSAETGASTPNAELSRLLLDLSQACKIQLQNQDFGFSLFLPAAETGINARTEAIAAWCRGFLLGISATGLNSENCGDVVKEILADIVELTWIEAEGANEAEEEKALLEVEEYLRVAAQLLKEELTAVNLA